MGRATQGGTLAPSLGSPQINRPHMLVVRFLIAECAGAAKVWSESRAGDSEIEGGGGAGLIPAELCSAWTFDHPITREARVLGARAGGGRPHVRC